MNLIERFRLFFGHGGAGLVGPPYIHLDVTRRCNLHCPGCRFHSPDGAGSCYPGDLAVRDISLGLVRQVAGEARRLAIREVILAGDGEPLLHPQLPEIVTILKAAGCAIRLYTNGTCLAEADDAVLFEPGVDDLIVSLWASSPDEYARCYPSNPRVFEQVTAGVQAVAARRTARGARTPRLTLCGPVTRDNFRNLGERGATGPPAGCRRRGIHRLPPDKARARRRPRAGSRATSTPSTRSWTDPPAGRPAGRRPQHPRPARQHRLGRTDWKLRPCYIGWLHLNVSTSTAPRPPQRKPAPGTPGRRRTGQTVRPCARSVGRPRHRADGRYRPTACATGAAQLKDIGLRQPRHPLERPCHGLLDALVAAPAKSADQSSLWWRSTARDAVRSGHIGDSSPGPRVEEARP